MEQFSARSVVDTLLKSQVGSKAIFEGVYGSVKFRPEDLEIKPGMFRIGFETEFITEPSAFGIETSQEVSVDDVDYRTFIHYFEFNPDHLTQWAKESGKTFNSYGLFVEVGPREAIKILKAEPIMGWAEEGETAIVGTYDGEEYPTLEDVADRLMRRGFNPVEIDAFNRFNVWNVQNDSSLGEGGVEVSSPIFPAEDAFEQMDKMFDFVDDFGFTDRRCGFHVGVSFTNKVHEIDFLKLIVLVGERGLTEMFKRTDNDYTRAHIPGLIRSFHGMLKELVNKMRHKGRGMRISIGELNDFMAKDKRMTVNVSKFHGSNPYIEFRIAGGEKYDKRLPEIKRAVQRYCAALAAAADPKAYRKEYLQQLARMVLARIAAPAPTSIGAVYKSAKEIMQKFSGQEVTEKANLTTFLKALFSRQHLENGIDGESFRRAFRAHKDGIDAAIRRLGMAALISLEKIDDHTALINLKDELEHYRGLLMDIEPYDSPAVQMLTQVVVKARERAGFLRAQERAATRERFRRGVQEFARGREQG